MAKKYSDTIRVLLKESSAQDESEKIIAIINSVVNNKKWHDRYSINVSNNKDEIIGMIKNQLKPYDYTKEQKDKLASLCYKVVVAFSAKNALKKISQNLRDVNVYYDVTLVTNIKDTVTKEIQSILSKNI